MTIRTEAPPVAPNEAEPMHAALTLTGWTCIGPEGWLPPWPAQLARPVAFERAVELLRLEASKPPRPPRAALLPA
jgi:hypothetical protein